MSSKSKVILAFAIGAAVGAAVAYYLNTEEGEETLKDLKDAAGKLKTDVEANLQKGRQIIDDITSTAQTLVKNIHN